MHPAVHVGRPCAARNVGHEARRPRRGPRRVPADRDRRSGHHRSPSIFRLLARQLDRLAIIRSVHHADVNHTTATHELLTGRPIPRPGGGEFREDWPHYGAVLAHLRRGHERTALPSYVQMRPEIPDGAPRFVEQSHGQGAGWMGPALSPFTIDHDPSKPDYHVGEFRLPDGLSFGRLADRRRLLQSVDDQARQLEAAAEIHALSGHYRRAYDLLASRKAIEAFDLSREDPRLRDRYGWHAHGQSVLQARRLVEAGVPLVTVFWPNEGLTNVSVYWDTHNRNFIDLKTRLMPPADQAFSALLDDLAARGLLDETLVVWTGEFGRTPRVGQSVVGGAGAGRDGRDHWAHCFSSVMAGAGIKGGTVHGASDRWAAYPARDPVIPSRHRRDDLSLPGRQPRHRAHRLPQPAHGTLPGPADFGDSGVIRMPDA